MGIGIMNTSLMSANTALEQAKVKQFAAKQANGRASVLEAEIKISKCDTADKEQELAETKEKVAGIQNSFGETIGIAMEKVENAVADAATTTEAATKENGTTRKTDTLEKSEAKFEPAYTKESAGKATESSAVYKRQSTLAMKNESMREAVIKLIGSQASENAKQSGIESILDRFGISAIKSDGSDDFWSAESTANRILDMAKSLVGDNTEAFGEIKSAFGKAFGQCEKIWGGKLPSVCYDTLNIVREGFDAWEKELTTKPQEQIISE